MGNKFTLDIAKVSNMRNGSDIHIARINKCAEKDAVKPVIVWGVHTHRLAGTMPPNWRVGGKRGFI